MRKLSTFFLFIFLFPILIGFNTKPAKIFGIKLYFNNKTFQDYFSKNDYNFINEIKDLNLNSIFFPPYEGSTAFYNSKIIQNKNLQINIDSIISICKDNRLKVGFICQIFYDPDFILIDSSLLPIDQYGNSTFTNWQKMVCPSNENYKKYKLKIIDELLELYKPDYINLDFIRYPVTWEIIKRSTPVDSLRNFCFCENCLNNFSRKYKLSLPNGDTKNIAKYILTNYAMEWKEFKEINLTEFVEKVKNLIIQKELKTKIIIHTLPWDNTFLNNSLENIAAQNLSKLSKHADYFSPMVYHQMINEPINYIKQIADYQFSKSKKSILPSILFNTTDASKNFSIQEFKDILNNSLNKSSDGFIIFNFNNLIDNRDTLIDFKKNYLKKFLKLYKNG